MYYVISYYLLFYYIIFVMDTLRKANIICLHVHIFCVRLKSDRGNYNSGIPFVLFMLAVIFCADCDLDMTFLYLRLIFFRLKFPN